MAPEVRDHKLKRNIGFLEALAMSIEAMGPQLGAWS